MRARVDLSRQLVTVGNRQLRMRGRPWWVLEKLVRAEGKRVSYVTLINLSRIEGQPMTRPQLLSALKSIRENFFRVFGRDDWVERINGRKARWIDKTPPG